MCATSPLHSFWIHLSFVKVNFFLDRIQSRIKTSPRTFIFLSTHFHFAPCKFLWWVVTIFFLLWCDYCFVYQATVLWTFGVNSLYCLSHFLIYHCLSMGMVLWPVLSGDDSSGRDSPLSPPERLPIRRSSTRDKNRRGETCFLLTTGDYTCTSDGGIRKGRRAFNQILTGDLEIKHCKISRVLRNSLPSFSRKNYT